MEGIARCSKVTKAFRSRASAAMWFSAHLNGYDKTRIHSAQNAAVTLRRVEMKLWKCTSQQNKNSPSRSKSQTTKNPIIVLDLQMHVSAIELSPFLIAVR